MDKKLYEAVDNLSLGQEFLSQLRIESEWFLESEGTMCRKFLETASKGQRKRMAETISATNCLLDDTA